MKKYLPSNLFNDELSLSEIRDMLRSLKKNKSKKCFVWFFLGLIVLGAVTAAVVLKLRSGKDDDFDDDFDDDDFDDDDFDDDDLDDEDLEDNECDCHNDDEVGTEE